MNMERPGQGPKEQPHQELGLPSIGLEGASLFRYSVDNQDGHLRDILDRWKAVSLSKSARPSTFPASH
jgi:hypothetical protein